MVFFLRKWKGTEPAEGQPGADGDNATCYAERRAPSIFVGVIVMRSPSWST